MEIEENRAKSQNVAGQFGPLNPPLQYLRNRIHRDKSQDVVGNLGLLCRSWGLVVCCLLLLFVGCWLLVVGCWLLITSVVGCRCWQGIGGNRRESGEIARCREAIRTSKVALESSLGAFDSYRQRGHENAGLGGSLGCSRNLWGRIRAVWGGLFG